MSVLFPNTGNVSPDIYSLSTFFNSNGRRQHQLVLSHPGAFDLVHRPLVDVDASVLDLHFPALVKDRLADLEAMTIRRLHGSPI